VTKAINKRRTELKQCLAEHDLGRGSFEAGSAWNASAAYYDRLAAALSALGPAFAAFGQYLSCRVDLLPMNFCLALAAIPDRSPPMENTAVFELIEHSGFEQRQLFDYFDVNPSQSRLFFQIHDARLHNGDLVMVKLMRPEVSQWLLNDVEFLLVLQEGIPEVSDRVSLESVVEDFCRCVTREMDLVREREVRMEMSLEGTGSMWLRMPRVHSQLCGDRMLTFERLDGITIADLITKLQNAAPTVGERVVLGSRLCRAWLQQALHGRWFPTAPNPMDLMVMPGHEIAFVGGGLARLSAHTQGNLLNYLTGAAAHDIDRACTYLLREMRPQEKSDEGRLRSALRQIAPFRDGGWESLAGYDTLSEHLVLQLRVFVEHDYRVPVPLMDFWRGLVMLAGAVRKLAPRHDVLRDGLEDLRVAAVFDQFRQLLDHQQIAENGDRYLALMMGFAKHLDDALTRVSEEERRHAVTSFASPASRYRSPWPTTVVVLIALLLAAWSLYLQASH
jgi:ubiquinone biosynthesis protein